MSGAASAQLTTSGTWTGRVGLSVDGVGSNNAAVGNVQAVISFGATILQAYLYSAGMPTGQYASSPRTLADYNSSGITLAGTSINFFDTLVGATSPRADIGRWFTARADVTSLVQSLTTGAATNTTSPGQFKKEGSTTSSTARCWPSSTLTRPSRWAAWRC